MKDSRYLRDAVRHALGLSAGVLAAVTAPTVAAQQQTGSEAPREELTITGSRIKRADLDSASPITVIDRKEILVTGLTDIGQVLQRMPAMSGSPNGTTTNNDGDGSVEIDLRGMGVDRTLTLINGKRMVFNGDYQTIPTLMVERIEILKDGASAVYGADAVAGVVNIITRRDFEGLEITAQASNWFDTDSGGEYSFGLVAGKVFDGGNFVFGAEYVDQEEVYQADVPWAFMQDTYYIYPEGCEAQLLAPYDGTPSGGCYPLGSSRIPESRLNFFDQGGFLIDTPAAGSYEAGLMEVDDDRLYNFAPVNYIQTPFSRTNIFAEAHFDIAETVRFNTEFRSNFRTSGQELAPMPYDTRSGLDPAHGGTFGGLPYNGISEDNYYLRQAVDVYNVANGAALAYQPVVDARRRMVETTRGFNQDVTQWQVVAGFDGTISDMDWDVFYSPGYRSVTDNDTGQFSGARLHNALGPSADLLDSDGQPVAGGDGQPECYGELGNAASLIEGCVPLNMFGGSGTMTEDMINYVQVSLVDTRTWETDSGGASLSGANFNLPGGEMGWAVGYGYWKQDFKYNADSGKQSGAVTGNKSDSTDGGLTNHSLYAEILAPLYDNGSQAFDVSVGLRYDDWDEFSSDTTWQLGVEFQVIENLKLRATAGTVFRAPTIEDLFEGLYDDFPTFTDPCAVDLADLPAGCDQVAAQDDTQVLVRAGGNPELQPETGDTFTAGIVWSPTFGNHGLSVTLDYWQIDLDDAITSFGVQYYLDQCYNLGIASACALIERRPGDYSVKQMGDPLLNIAEQGANGVDTEIRYSFDSNIGLWDASLLWAHLLERTKTAFDGAEEEDLSGRYTDPTAEDGGAYAEDKIQYAIGWSRGGWSITYLGEYISGLDADTFCNCFEGNQPDGSYTQSIDSFLYMDLIGTFETDFTGAGTTVISVGITNFTDEEPPFMDVGFNATTDPPTYRMMGIGWFLRLSHHFE